MSNATTSIPPPIQEQPISIIRTATEVEYGANFNSLASCRNPAVLGPIPLSEPKDHVMGPRPIIVECHMCNQKIKTEISYSPTLKTHLVAACLCATGCICCWCLPYCLNSCNKTDHYCPYCSAFIGSYYIE